MSIIIIIMIMIRSSRSFLESAASALVQQPLMSTMGQSLAIHAGDHRHHDQHDQEDDAGDHDDDDDCLS